MTLAYKYCETKIQTIIANGSIRLRPLDYFRESKQTSIGDPNDGHFQETVTGTFKAGESLYMNSPIEPVGLIVNEGSGGIIDVSNFLVTSKVNPLVFCASVEQNDKLWSSYNPPYDSAVLIYDFERLAIKVKNALAMNFSVTSFKYEKISYGKPKDLAPNTLAGVDPFRKNIEYKEEKEIRMIFYVEGKTPEYFDVNVNPNGLLKALK